MEEKAIPEEKKDATPFFCETCKSSIPASAREEHDPKHTVYPVAELGQKLIAMLSKEDDLALLSEIRKLDEELVSEVKKLKGWFDNIETKVLAAVRQCMGEVVNEVLEQTNEKLGKKRTQMEETLKVCSEGREAVIDALKDAVTAGKPDEILKHVDLFYKCAEKERLFAAIGGSKMMWTQHIRKMKAISAEFLKDTVSSALRHLFYTPLLYIIPNKSNQLITFDPATNKRNVYTMEGLVKTRHFDSVLVKNVVYIAGGQSDEAKAPLSLVWEYELLEGGNVLTQKADMLKGRFGHKMICASESFVYALGGIVISFLGTKYTNHCEKYDRVYDRWVEVGGLHENKGYMSACQFQSRFIYIFGGFCDDVASESSSTVEFLDTMIESEGWKLVKFSNINKKWIPISQAGVVQLGKQMLLLFGGRTSKTKFSSDCFLYSVRDNTMKQLECKIARPTAFYQRSIVEYKDGVYSFDATDCDLHVFDPTAIKWKVVKRPDWDHV